MVELQITLDGKKEKVRKGTKIIDLLGKDRDLSYKADPVIAAKLNGKIVSLSEPILGNATISGVHLLSPFGKRVYRKSLCFLLSYASAVVAPERSLIIGHMVLCGLGGIFIEVLKDVKAGLAPLSREEALGMIKELKSYKIIQGVRGQEPVNEQKFAEAVSRVSALVKVAPEIFEMDLNPLLGNRDNVVAVDARIRIEK